jgi:hypothetical protein
MIIYGVKNKQLLKESVMDKCPHCGTQNNIDIHIFEKYAHVFWIPFFPTDKTGVSECKHCKQVLKLKEMPDALRNSYENLKPQTKTPIWMFSGLALIVAFVTIAIITGKQKDERNGQLIITPQKGDVYEIKTDDRNYTLYKIAEVQNDSVYIHPSNFQSNKASGLAELKRKGNSVYSEDLIGFSKTELKQMLDKGEIRDIERE